ncbi:hypothetical protein [Streptomyces sp. NPDC048659]|uniref:hypothetical protein n=1 Tax=Streptomyces sp. NPDC048659 TaxID=3155489 RepID=UPI0034455A0E
MSRTKSLLATAALSLLLTGLATTTAAADGTGIGWDAARMAPTGDTGIGWDVHPAATTPVGQARRGL